RRNAQVLSREVAVIRVRVNDRRVFRIDRMKGTLTAGSRAPLDGRNTIPPVGQIDLPPAASNILNRSIRPCRCAVVECDVVELPTTRRDSKSPGRSSIRGEIHAAVVGAVKRGGVVRIDPQAVMIAVSSANRRKRFTAVMRNIESQTQRVDRLVVLGIDTNLAKHPAVGS